MSKPAANLQRRCQLIGRSLGPEVRRHGPIRGPHAQG